MKNFAILRNVPEDMTWKQADAAAIQNMINMGLSEDERDIAWEPRILGVTWVRSYWELGSTWGTCLYTSKDEKAVRDWHDLCGVAYAGIREIELEEAPEARDEYPRGFHAEREAAPLVALEMEPRGNSAEPPGEYRWLRTYRDAASGEELRLYLADDTAEAPPPAAGVAVRRVVELRPADYE